MTSDFRLPPDHMPTITFTSANSTTSPSEPESIYRDALCAIRAASLIDFASTLEWAQWERRLAQAALDGDSDRVASEILAWEEASQRRRPCSWADHSLL